MKSSVSLKVRVCPIQVSPKLPNFCEKREGKDDGGASSVMEKEIPKRQTEGATGETSGKGEHNLVMLLGTGKEVCVIGQLARD